MNHGHHLAAWYGAIGMGGIVHTINPRLFDDQLVYIANHAEDRVLLYDRAFQPIVDRLRARWTSIEHYIVMDRSVEHTSELQSLMRISYAVFCLKTKNIITFNTISSIL